MSDSVKLGLIILLIVIIVGGVCVFKIIIDLKIAQIQPIDNKLIYQRLNNIENILSDLTIINEY